METPGSTALCWSTTVPLTVPVVTAWQNAGAGAATMQSSTTGRADTRRNREGQLIAKLELLFVGRRFRLTHRECPCASRSHVLMAVRQRCRKRVPDCSSRSKQLEARTL